MNKNQKEENKSIYIKIKIDIMQRILNSECMGFHNLHMEIKDKLPKSYFTRLKNDFKRLGLKVELEKLRSTNVIHIEWDDMLYESTKLFREKRENK